MKLLHTADVHLDKPFRWLGNRGREQRSQLKETFRAVVKLAHEERVDAMLVAGDLFDSNWPSQDSIDLVQTQLRGLGAPVFLLPGTHDCLDDGSIYRKVDFTGSDGSNIHVFDDSHAAFVLDALGLTVHGRANRTNTSTESPLKGITRQANTRFHVALAHGSLAIPGAEDDFPLTLPEIDATGMDYVALGHWHSYRDCPTRRSKACYCGPPELLAEDQQGGYVLLVDLTDRGVTVKQHSVGQRKLKKVRIPMDGIFSAVEIRECLHDLGDANLVLSVVLTGVRQLGLVIDPAELSRDLADAFFAIKVDDQSHPALSPEKLKAFPENLVIGQFVRRMESLIEQASDIRERRVREAALQVGVALLQGKKVLG